MAAKGTQAMTWIMDLDAFRVHPATQPIMGPDGTLIPSPLLQLIDRKRTPIIYGDEYGDNPNESIAFLCDLADGIKEAIEANPDIVTWFSDTQVFGDPNNVARDPETDEVLKHQVAGTTTKRTKVQVGTETVTPTRMEKRITDGYVLQDVEVPVYETTVTVTDVVDEDGGVRKEKSYTRTQVDTRIEPQLVYTLEPEVDADGNAIYPPKHYYVEVPVPEEAYEQPVWDWQEETVPTLTMEPLLDPIAPDPVAREVYDRVYPRTPQEVDDGEGGTIMVTPPLRFGFIDGHV